MEESHYEDHVKELISSNALYKSVTERYYSKRFCVDVNNIVGNDHLLLFHSNKICLVTLAPSHPVFGEENLTIDYQVGNLDRTKNMVKGKGKKGGQHLENNSILCKITGSNGKVYDVRSCIKGKLIEVNENLIENPNLLKTNPDSEGYIAVVLSQIPTSNSRKEELLKIDEYEEILLKRKNH